MKAGGHLSGQGALLSHILLTVHPPFCRADPHLYHYKGLLIPKHGTWHLPLPNFMFLLAHSCSLSMSLWTVALPSSTSTAVPI